MSSVLFFSVSSRRPPPRVRSIELFTDRISPGYEKSTTGQFDLARLCNFRLRFNININVNVTGVATTTIRDLRRRRRVSCPWDGGVVRIKKRNLTGEKNNIAGVEYPLGNVSDVLEADGFALISVK